jgi:hypothetical protein
MSPLPERAFLPGQEDSPTGKQGKFVRIIAFRSPLRYAYRLWEKEKTYLFERESGFGKSE